MAEDELVEIVPNMRMDPLNFIWGFWPVSSTNTNSGAHLACSGFEEEWKMCNSTSTVDVCCACDDIPDIYTVRSLIEDIRDVRLHKLETNLETFSGTTAVKIANLSAMEVNIVRRFVRRALQAFYKHDKPDPMPDKDGRRPPREANNEPRRPLRQR